MSMNDYSVARPTSEEKGIALAFTLIAITSTLAINHADSTIPEREYVWMAHSLMAMSLLFLLFKIVIKYSVIYAKWLFAIFLFWYFVTAFYVYRSPDISLNLSTISALLIFCCFNRRIWIFSYRLYYKYMVLMSAVGILAFLSLYLPVIDLPRGVCPYYGDRLSDSYLYYDYYFSYIVVMGPFARLGGLFNEPGYFGTFLALILAAENFNMKRLGNKILMTAGVFTFSVAFFVTLLLFFVLRLVVTGNFKIIIGGILLLVMVAILGAENENVAHLMERFTFIDGKLAAINRTGSSFDYFFDRFIRTPRLFLGYGRGYLEYHQEIGNLSYKTYLVEYGLVACLIFWGGLFYNAVKYSERNRVAVIFAVLFMINIYQRPGIFVFGYMLLLFGGVCHIVANSQSKPAALPDDGNL